MTTLGTSIVVFIAALVLGCGLAWRSRIRAKAAKQLPQARRRPGEFFLILGLMLSSVFDPASRHRVEMIDRQKVRKPEPGKENE